MAAPTKAEVRATFERIAEPFAASRAEPWPEVLSFTTSLPRAARLLDAGCGNGRQSRALVAAGHRALDVLDDLRSALAGQEVALLVGRSIGPTGTRPWFLDRAQGSGGPGDIRNTQDRAPRNSDLAGSPCST